MAETAFGVNDPQTVKRWSTLLMKQAIYDTYYMRFSGRNEMAAFQILTDLERAAGDTIKFDILERGSGYGVNQNATLLQNEEAIAYAQDQVLIEQKRFGRAWFRMSSQRSVHQLRRDGMTNISDDISRTMDEYLFAHLCGTAGANTALATDINTDHGANPLVAIDANHAKDATAGDFGTLQIDEARWLAETLPNPIKRLRVDGEEVYLMFIRPEQARSLQQDPDWRSAMENADPRGTRNRIFTGAMGKWNSVVVHVANYLPKEAPAAGSAVNYAVLCGRQAAVTGFGQAYDRLDRERYTNGPGGLFQWVETVETDYGNRKAVSGGMVFGTKRTDFDIGGGGSEANGVIRIATTEAELTA